MDAKVFAVLAIYEQRLEAENRRRREGTFDLHSSLLAVGPATGQLINTLAGSLRAPQILEIGTSFGYSTLWLAEAARAAGGKLTTIELEPSKSEYARTMMTRAGLAEYVDFKIGDAVTIIPHLPFSFDFVLLDLWKELYPACLAAFYPKLSSGAIIVADNMLGTPFKELQEYSLALRKKPGMMSVVLPVGSGIEVSRSTPSRQ